MAKTANLVAMHFEDLEQQEYAAQLGMWVFLVTETLFFGALFTGYAVYRHLYPQIFADASRHLNVLIGCINTAVLICSSFTIVLALHFIKSANKSSFYLFTVLTIALGSLFLGLKFYEYYHKYQEGLVPGIHYTHAPESPAVLIFFSLYFVMTGMHALHMIVGLGLLAYLILLAWQGKILPQKHTWVELTALYWHFVDIVWVFLFPLLYLIGAR